MARSTRAPRIAVAGSRRFENIPLIVRAILFRKGMLPSVRHRTTGTGPLRILPITTVAAVFTRRVMIRRRKATPKRAW